MLTNDFLKIMGNIVQNITIDTLKTSLYQSPEQRISSDIQTTCSGCKKMLGMSLIQPTFGCLSIFGNTVSHLKVQSNRVKHIC